MLKSRLSAAIAAGALMATVILGQQNVAFAGGSYPSHSPTPPTSACPSGNAAVVAVNYVFRGINGTVRTASTLWNNSLPGDRITVNFQVANGCRNVQLSFVSYTSPGDVFDPATASQDRVVEQQTGYFSPGWHSLTVRVPNTNSSSYACNCFSGVTNHYNFFNWPSSYGLHSLTSYHSDIKVNFNSVIASKLGGDASYGFNKHKSHKSHNACADFYQVDFVRGPVIQHLGPAGSNNFYTAQGRLIDSDLG